MLITQDYNSMGQINCQCQYVPQEETGTLRKNSSQHSNIYTQETEVAAIFTKVTLRNKNNIIDIKMKEGASLDFGTSDDCDHRPAHLNGNSYKMQLRLTNHSLYAQDLGFGLGVFLLKKKIFQKCDGSDVLLSIDDNFARLKLKLNEEIVATTYNLQTQETTSFKTKEDQQIQVGSCSLLIKRQKDGKQYSIKRTDRKNMWVLLSQQRKIKLHDVLRLGCEFYEIDSITNFIESSKIVAKY